MRNPLPSRADDPFSLPISRTNRLASSAPSLLPSFPLLLTSLPLSPYFRLFTFLFLFPSVFTLAFSFGPLEGRKFFPCYRVLLDRNLSKKEGVKTLKPPTVPYNTEKENDV